MFASIIPQKAVRFSLCMVMKANGCEENAALQQVERRGDQPWLSKYRLLSRTTSSGRKYWS